MASVLCGSALGKALHLFGVVYVVVLRFHYLGSRLHHLGLMIDTDFMRLQLYLWHQNLRWGASHSTRRNMLYAAFRFVVVVPLCVVSTMRSHARARPDPGRGCGQVRPEFRATVVGLKSGPGKRHARIVQAQSFPFLSCLKRGPLSDPQTVSMNRVPP